MSSRKRKVGRPASRGMTMSKFLRSSSLFLCLGVLTAPALAQQPSSITVAWYGANWGDAFRACVAEPFTKATGIAVNAEIGTSSVTLAKLQQQKGAPTIDVA